MPKAGFKFDSNSLALVTVSCVVDPSSHTMISLVATVTVTVNQTTEARGSWDTRAVTTAMTA